MAKQMPKMPTPRPPQYNEGGWCGPMLTAVIIILLVFFVLAMVAGAQPPVDPGLIIPVQ